MEKGKRGSRVKVRDEALLRRVSVRISGSVKLFGAHCNVQDDTSKRI